MKRWVKFAVLLLVVGTVCCTAAGILSLTSGQTISLPTRSLSPAPTALTLPDTSGVTAVRISVDAAAVSVREGEDWALSSNLSVPKNLSYTVRSGTLCISQTDAKHGWFSRNPQIVLTVPSGTALTQFSCELDAGTLEAGRLSAQDLSLKVDTGTLSVSQMDADTLTASCDAGSISLTGVLHSSGSVACDLGSMQLTLLDGSGIATLDGTVDLGSVRVDGEPLSRTFHKSWLPTDGTGTLSLQCDAGSISVTTPNHS